MRRVIPLTGRVLVELCETKRTLAEILLPNCHVGPEEQQQRDHHPTAPPPVEGWIREIGPWPKLKNGMSVLPPFGVGARVLVPKHAGISMSWDVSGRLKMLNSDQILAVLT